ncbi:MAG: sodium:solute symporter family protein [Acidobacteriota bacterium]
MILHLVLLVAYSAVLLTIGFVMSRRVNSTGGFFVANRSLGAGLIFSTMLAANIGAGSTVGATGLGYQYGLSAWWWNGSAGLGSLLLAFWIGPRVWRAAARHGFLTTGDLVEHYFGRFPRAFISSMLWLASLSILAGQLIGVAWILNVVAGLPKWAGCLIGGGLMTTYFAAGGLLGAAWVNMVQLAVLLGGFAIAVPMILNHAGGAGSVLQVSPAPAYGSFWGGAQSMSFLVLLVPAFISSPGLLQKAFGASGERAVRLGVGANAVVLLVFAFVPALLGMAARTHHAGLPQELALPALLAHDLPVGFGSLMLAAIFSAEVSTADAVLFMLSTSLSQDLYRRFVNPAASDGDVLRVARWSAVTGGAFGVLIALVTPTIVGALSIFYAVLGATLFVPILVALHARLPRGREVSLSIAAGAAAVVVAQAVVGNRVGTMWTPAVIGLTTSVTAYVMAVLWNRLTRQA